MWKCMTLLLAMYVCYDLYSINVMICPAILNTPSVMVYHINMIKYQHKIEYCNGTDPVYVHTIYGDTSEIEKWLKLNPTEIGYNTTLGSYNDKNILLYYVIWSIVLSVILVYWMDYTVVHKNLDYNNDKYKEMYKRLYDDNKN